jgi:hypothetical protein
MPDYLTQDQSTLTRYLVKVTDQGRGAEASAAPWTALAIHEGCSNWRAMTSDKITTTISVIRASATTERDFRDLMFP